MTVLSKSSDAVIEDPEMRAARVVLAQQTYRNFPPALRADLLVAVTRCRRVREALQLGYWTTLVRSLRGLTTRTGDERWGHLAFLIDQETPHALEGLLPRQ